MKQPVTQKKLIINNRKFGYFITLLKIKFLASPLASKNPYLHHHQFCADVSPSRNLLRLVLVAVNNFNYKCFVTLRGATSIYFSLHMKVKCIFYAWDVLPRYGWLALH